MKVRDIAVAIPAHRVSSDTLAAWVQMDRAFITDKIGVESRAFLREEENLLDLAMVACQQLWERNPALSSRQVELLMVVTQNPDFKLPHSSALLQKALALDNNTACFDVNLGCSGYVYALSIAKGFMAAEGIADGIVVTCDPYSKIMGPTDRDTLPLFGDAATATWLSRETGGELGRLDYGTDGGGANHLIVKAGGSAYPVSNLWKDAGLQYPLADFRLHMNGRAIFNFMMERVPVSVKNCLVKNDLQISDIDYFVFHQASKFLLEQLGKRMNLPPAKVPCNLREVGNTVSSSIPLLLSQMMDQRLLHQKNVLISGFGVGLSWATNIIRF